MKRFTLFHVAALVAATLLPPASHAASPGGDRKAIVGVWLGGMPGEPPGTIELVITPTKISGRNPRTGESLGEGTYQLDPEAKTIDAFKGSSVGRGRTYYGLYSLEGDRLRWCSNSRSKRRPADLVHRPERDQFLMVLQRRR